MADTIPQWLAASARRNRQHDAQVLAAVGLQQDPPTDLGDWPPVTQPGATPDEAARRLKHLLWCTLADTWGDTRTSTCGHRHTPPGAP